MMITPDILPILRCPFGGDSLVLAEPELVERVNEAISAGAARDQLGTRVETPIDAGMVNSAKDRLYPVRENIATLIADSAIQIKDLR
ncbi:uncharacterized protein YbaR (Trm112 family) [Rhodopirellula rubra]|uniref:Uncharacterized protein YbaR (Trm112 family) n=1 Tax=Aporhodopirellula rubra TaxID=980271 RepID=A0A7W5E4X8_9BACT|nr:Trm112 family protein [Aporhodopirellula rubra]MBB3209892.1 uncharacterized protein YbaR (Trm112 family) [Aporhodopirellula rubra]